MLLNNHGLELFTIIVIIAFAFYTYKDYLDIAMRFDISSTILNPEPFFMSQISFFPAKSFKFRGVI